MCTLSFLPTRDGYIAAMNRDELRTRPQALPPGIHAAGEVSLIYPREPGGGTWIGVNSQGVSLALLNWYSAETEELGEKSRSRGEIIPTALPKANAEDMEEMLRQLDLAGIYPFRLFGFFPGEKQICEWRWDAWNLSRESHAWRRQHWFSSSRSDKQAAVQRGMACTQAWCGDPAYPALWLRELHASHEPAPGPFSVCVHREDAATVSYTEVEWLGSETRMRYLAGNPCEARVKPKEWSLRRLGVIQ
jgi:Transport and Golgi organisation 2